VYLVPPMADEPPPEFVEFVAEHLPSMVEDARRLTGGSEQSTGIATLVLSDIAIHWRRLQLRSRVAHTDAVREFAHRRLALRTKQWREEQIYPVEVRILRPMVHAARFPSSFAARKADVLASTVRTATAPFAEAAIAWTDARHRAMVHRIVRTTVTILLLFAIFFSLFPGAPA
jgi:hypothetical protein